MARNVDDLKMLWSLLRGTPEQKRCGIKDTRIAIWDEEASWPLAREVREAVENAGDALEDAGANVEHVKPDIDGAALMDAYMAILTPIIALDMPPEMLGAFAAMREADRKLIAEQGDGAATATFRYRASAPFREIVGAMIARQAMKDALRSFFGTYDAILMPVTFVPPFPHLQEGSFADRVLDVDGETVPYNNLLNWIAPASALHAPSLAVPASRTSKGLPVGVQLVGPWNGEDRLFDFGLVLEEALGGFVKPAL
jgi:amidase